MYYVVMKNIFFKTDRKVGTKYKNSLYYNGTRLWNDVAKTIQFADTVGVFKQRIRPMYKIYVNLL